jgi:signal peptidase I
MLLAAGCIGILLLCLIIGICVIQFTLLIVTVEHQSMAPTFQHGDRILVLRRWFGPWIRKGSIVLISSPQDTAISLAHRPNAYVKRVVALSEETITIPTPYRDARHQEQTGHEEPDAQNTVWEEQTWHIPARHLFVCGDNRSASIDSRQWGPLPLSSVTGLMLTKLRHAPAQRAQTSVPSTKSSFAKGLQPGQAAPNFSACTMQGETLALQNYQGHMLLLLFVAGAPSMRQCLPAYLSFAYNLEERGVTTLLACDADVYKAQMLLQELEPRLPVLIVSRLQHSMLEDYCVSIMPAYYLIDTRGCILTGGLAMLGERFWQEEIMSRLPQKQSEVV